MKATVLAESFLYFISSPSSLSAPVISTDVSQVGVAHFSSFENFLSFHLSRFSFYINRDTAQYIFSADENHSQLKLLHFNFPFSLLCFCLNIDEQYFQGRCSFVQPYYKLNFITPFSIFLIKDRDNVSRL